MKQIHIDASTWGKGYLQTPRSGKKCCLGFASEQLGAVDIKGKYMPCDIDGPKRFRMFQTAISNFASENLMAEAVNLTGHMATDIGFTLASVLAHVNDWYHDRSSKHRAELLEPTLKVLRQGFAEAGYKLVYRSNA